MSQTDHLKDTEEEPRRAGAGSAIEATAERLKRISPEDEHDDDYSENGAEKAPETFEAAQDLAKGSTSPGTYSRSNPQSDRPKTQPGKTASDPTPV